MKKGLFYTILIAMLLGVTSMAWAHSSLQVITPNEARIIFSNNLELSGWEIKQNTHHLIQVNNLLAPQSSLVLKLPFRIRLGNVNLNNYNTLFGNRHVAKRKSQYCTLLITKPTIETLNIKVLDHETNLLNILTPCKDMININLDHNVQNDDSETLITLSLK